jgi:hypothetical protein
MGDFLRGKRIYCQMGWFSIEIDKRRMERNSALPRSLSKWLEELVFLFQIAMISPGFGCFALKVS